MSKITMIHTVPSLAEQFEELLGELLPDASTRHVVAEHLLQRTIEEGRLSELTGQELDALVREVSEDADMVVVTCSTLGPAVDAIDLDGPVTLHRVDTAMAERAVRLGSRIGVLATLRTTLEPTAELIERTAEAEGREVEVISHLCDGAFEAVRGGEPERHDDLVRLGLEELRDTVDVIVLAQASMARAIQGSADDPAVPVLSSPRLAVERLADQLGPGGGA